MTSNSPSSPESDSPTSPREARLPKLTVNVIPPTEVHASDLTHMLDRFERGETDPLILGRTEPEAALIPFAAFLRLLRRDHVERLLNDQTDATELNSRLADLDADPDSAVPLDEVLRRLGHQD